MVNQGNKCMVLGNMKFHQFKSKSLKKASPLGTRKHKWCVLGYTARTSFLWKVGN